MKIVLVKWKDATTFGEWKSADAVDKTKFQVCYAAGFLVTENTEVVTIALLTSEDKENFSNWINIPSECVLELTTMCETDWVEGFVIKEVYSD